MKCLSREFYLAIVAFGMIIVASPASSGERAGSGNGYPEPSSYQSAVAPIREPSPSADASAFPARLQSPPQLFENQPLAFARTDTRRQRADGEGEQRMPSVWPALLAVFVVCGIFCFILYCVKKYLPGHRQLFSHPAMEVLGRTHLDQRRYISLLRVGRRIVVIGVSPDEMRALSEITDEEEVTGIMEVARPRTEAGLSIFQRLFQRQVAVQEAEETRAMAGVKVGQIDEQISALRERIREIRQKEKPVEPRRVDTMG